MSQENEVPEPTDAEVESDSEEIFDERVHFEEDGRLRVPQTWLKSSGYPLKDSVLEELDRLPIEDSGLPTEDSGFRPLSFSSGGTVASWLDAQLWAARALDIRSCVFTLMWARLGVRREDELAWDIHKMTIAAVCLAATGSVPRPRRWKSLASLVKAENLNAIFSHACAASNSGKLSAAHAARFVCRMVFWLRAGLEEMTRRWESSEPFKPLDIEKRLSALSDKIDWSEAAEDKVDPYFSDPALNTPYIATSIPQAFLNQSSATEKYSKETILRFQRLAAEHDRANHFVSHMTSIFEDRWNLDQSLTLAAEAGDFRARLFRAALQNAVMSIYGVLRPSGNQALLHKYSETLLAQASYIKGELEELEEPGKVPDQQMAGAAFLLAGMTIGWSKSSRGYELPNRCFSQRLQLCWEVLKDREDRPPKGKLPTPVTLALRIAAEALFFRAEAFTEGFTKQSSRKNTRVHDREKARDRTRKAR